MWLRLYWVVEKLLRMEKNEHAIEEAMVVTAPPRYWHASGPVSVRPGLTSHIPDPPLWHVKCRCNQPQPSCFNRLNMEW